MINQRMKQKIFPNVCLIVSLFVFLMTESGCEPLRKKFTRQKKKTEVQQEVPILEPIEYPENIKSPQDTYQHHFNLWRVWHKELIGSMTENESRKRRLYFMEQVVINLEMMRDLLKGEKKDALIACLKKIQLIEQQLQSSMIAQNFSSLRRQLESLEKKIRDEFALKSIEESIQP
ncbi:MAG: hypothetical protein ABIJ41_03505 [Candidatus Omnitrophota bacterium]